MEITQKCQSEGSKSDGIFLVFSFGQTEHSYSFTAERPENEHKQPQTKTNRIRVDAWTLRTS